jgi:hypothetical protein
LRGYGRPLIAVFRILYARVGRNTRAILPLPQLIDEGRTNEAARRSAKVLSIAMASGRCRSSTDVSCR